MAIAKMCILWFTSYDLQAFRGAANGGKHASPEPARCCHYHRPEFHQFWQSAVWSGSAPHTATGRNHHGNLLPVSSTIAFVVHECESEE